MPPLCHTELGPCQTALVLEPAHDVERRRQVHVDVVELAERQVLDEAPGVAAIAREVDPAVVAVDQELAVGAHPERVVIPVHPGLDPGESFCRRPPRDGSSRASCTARSSLVGSTRTCA